MKFSSIGILFETGITPRNNRTISKNKNNIFTTFVLSVILGFLISTSLFSQNLFKNGDFENGLENWIVTEATGITIDNSTSFNGKNSVKLSVDQQEPLQLIVGQELLVQEGISLELQYAVKSDKVDGRSNIYCEFNSSTEKLYAHSLEEVSDKSEWHRIKARINVPPTSERFLILIYFNAAHATVWYDDLQLTILNDTTPNNYSVDLNSSVGTYRSFQATNAGPLNPGYPGQDFSSQFKELKMEMVRTHDFNGPCDVHTIFPNPDADVNDPASYDFQESDKYIESIANLGCEIFYRLGESYEVEPIYNELTMDTEKWADVCVNIVKHYNQGWNNWYHFNIKYWEIWNEPDLEHHWKGSLEEYIELYRITAQKIKALDSSLRVGGPVVTSVYRTSFIKPFLDDVTTKNIPLDFFSYHKYDSTNPYFFVQSENHIRKLLAEYGLSDIETIISEWTVHEFAADNKLALDWNWIRDDATSAALKASTLSYFQFSTIGKAIHYRTDEHLFGIIRNDGNLSFPGLAMKALAAFDTTPNLLSTTGSDSTGNTILAGRSDSGEQLNIVISNHASKACGYNLEFKNLSSESNHEYTIFRINSENEYKQAETGQLTNQKNTIITQVTPPFVDHIRVTANHTKIETGQSITALSDFSLEQNYPNPFNAVTIISFSLNKQAFIKLSIFDLLGKEIQTLKVGEFECGYYSIPFDASSLTSGIYLIQLETNRMVHTRKMLLLK